MIAAVAGPAWFDRDKAGFEDPALDPAMLGLLTIIIVPVQLLLIAFAMRGFQQQWNVEVEVAREAGGPGGPAGGRVQPPDPRRYREGGAREPSDKRPTLSRPSGGVQTGIGGGLKNRCPKGRVGSNPIRRTP